jgi:hypothetical protein
MAPTLIGAVFHAAISTSNRAADDIDLGMIEGPCLRRLSRGR